MKQYEVTNHILRYGHEMKLDKNEYHILAYLSCLLNLDKFPTGSIKVTKAQIQEGSMFGRDAVNKAINGLKAKGFVKYICTRQFILEVNVIKIMPIKVIAKTAIQVNTREVKLEEVIIDEDNPPF